MGHILDSREYAQRYNISRTAADTYKYLLGVVYMSRVHGKYRDRDGYYAYIGRATIAEKIGKSESTAARAIAELKAAGLIKTKRTRKFGRVYICEVGTACIKNDTARNTKNDTTNNSITSIDKNIDTSFYLNKMAEGQNKTADDVKKCEGYAHDETPAATPAAKETKHNEQTAKKGKPTPKRRQRLTKAEKEAAREKYRRMLERKLDMANPIWMIPSLDDEYRQYQSLIDTLADALSVRGRGIRVNGAELTVEQHWQVVQNISGKAIDGLFDRLKTAAVCTGITNMRAYTLASVYNAVLWHGMTANADINLDAVYRRMA